MPTLPVVRESVLTGSVCNRLDVQNDDLDTELVEKGDNVSAYTSSAASDEDNFTRPVVVIAHTVVARSIRIPVGGRPEKTKIKKRLDAPVC